MYYLDIIWSVQSSFSSFLGLTKGNFYETREDLDTKQNFGISKFFPYAFYLITNRREPFLALGRALNLPARTARPRACLFHGKSNGKTLFTCTCPAFRVHTDGHGKYACFLRAANKFAVENLARARVTLPNFKKQAYTNDRKNLKSYGIQLIQPCHNDQHLMQILGRKITCKKFDKNIDWR